MRNLWLHSIKLYLRIGLFFYFGRIKVVGLDHIPKDKPVLLLSNHQNALIDALLIATRLPYFAYYLTRAGVFKKEIVSKLLNSFNMLPVYRIRDGWSNLTNNNPVFEKCKKLLHARQTVVIFPEGSHNLARRVRPLSKGFTRIVFDTLDTYPDTDLHLVPLGLNFKNPKDFVDSASLYFGKPILASDYLTENRNEDIARLRQDMQRAITGLTTHIPKEHYDDSLKKLEQLQVDFLEPNSVNACISSNFQDCKKQPQDNFNGIRKVLKVLLKLSVFLPYLLWKLWIQPKIKELEFTATFRFAVAITLVPLFIIVMSLILAAWFGIQVAMIYFISVILIALLTVKL